MGVHRPSYTEILNSTPSYNNTWLFEKPLQKRGYFLMDLDTWRQYESAHRGTFYHILTNEKGYIVLDHPNGKLIKTPTE